MDCGLGTMSMIFLSLQSCDLVERYVCDKVLRTPKDGLLL